MELTKPEIIQTAQALKCLPENKSGSRLWSGNCPAKHGSEKGRCFNIYEDTQSFFCFHCRAGGDAFNLIKLAQNCDFKSAVYWAKEHGLISGNGHDAGNYAALRKVHQILTDAARFFNANLKDLSHLKTHYGLSEATIQQYLIGYAPLDKHALKKHLSAKGHKLADIKKTGLLGKFDDSFFQGQYVFPYWNQGLVKYFIGRQTPETPTWKNGKYEKLPNTETIKNAFFYGEDSIKGRDTCFIMEGVTDCLAALQHGLPSISPVTVQFKKSDHPKLLSLVRGKKVFLVPDNEENEAGIKGAQETQAFLKNNGIEAHIITLPRPAGKDKVDFNEYVRDHGIEAFSRLVEAAPKWNPPAPDPAMNGGESEPQKILWVGHNYFVENGRLCLEQYDRQGMPKTSYLANFQAQIIEEITRDDGLRAVKEFMVKGNLDTGRPLPPARIPARDFDGLLWVRREWGMGASQAPGRSLGPHLVNAIMAHSQGAKRCAVYAHSGWRQIAGVWRYLHGGGAIGEGEPVEVDLGENLQLYRLPAPGGVGAAQASLRFLDIGPWEITAPLIACGYLAPFADLCKIDFSLWLYGPTGGLKSTIAALALSHFGNFSRTTLPGSWLSTANSLEKLCFTLKDSLAVIDDFIPPSSPRDSYTQTEKAARLIYQAGNRSSRGRLAADLSARPNHYPRCLIISTGEILLPGQRQSATARYLGIELDQKRNPIDKARLTAAQGEANLYPGAMAAYLADLAPRLEDVQAELLDLWEGYRTAFQSEAHLRVPEIQAWLAVGFEYFLRFQARMGAITEDQEYEMLKRAWRVFEALGKKHSSIIEGQRPTLKFLAVLKELFYQGQIYAESDTTAGGPPQAREALGWQGTEPARNAQFVGWADESSVYLMPETTLRVVNEAIRRQGDFLSLGRNDLLAALAREGFIEPGKDSQKGRNTHVKKIQGASKRVICLPLEKLAHDEALEDENL